ncbi:hypothetical protein BaRGS_00004172 [Batillaria attramentaria]|uniref:Uncharacterized protein n=1 Tax=Batillaria attramentaria TaxID=370345 RepID=A0ABD0LYX4_9CAEN
MNTDTQPHAGQYNYEVHLSAGPHKNASHLSKRHAATDLKTIMNYTALHNSTPSFLSVPESADGVDDHAKRHEIIHQCRQSSQDNMRVT